MHAVCTWGYRMTILRIFLLHPIRGAHTWCCRHAPGQRRIIVIIGSVTCVSHSAGDAFAANTPWGRGERRLHT